jgi:hypothetical protein
MSLIVPLQYLGEGQFQAPPGHARRCDKALVIGEQLTWEQVNPRSMASHNHQFASIGDAWANLPERLAPDFPTADHLRKHCLIKAGYCTIHRVVCRDNHEAITACSIFSAMDTYAICTVEGSVATMYRAESQSIKAMGAKKFYQSKTAVLDLISEMIGADAHQAGQAA